MRSRLSFASALAIVVGLAACGGDDDGAAPIDARRTDAATDAGDPDASDPDAAVDAAADAASPDASVDAAPDAAPDAGTDGPTGDAPPPVGAHLLITEVKTVDNSEFIEIYNPTDQVISLRNYYLTDHQSYFLLPGGTPPATDQTDFLARFPMGASIAPRQVITVATDAVGFEAAFSMVPTYTVQELGNSTAMELVWQGPTNPNPGLTNAGEMVALFFWDGATDTVRDVDIVVAGNAPTAANTIIAKTAVDGPDADAATTAYATDALTIQDMETDTPNGTSYKRIAFETGHEVQTSTGNGITGDDETSEALRMTWDSQSTATNYTAATPGVVPAVLNP